MQLLASNLSTLTFPTTYGRDSLCLTCSQPAEYRINSVNLRLLLRVGKLFLVLLLQMNDFTV